MGMVARGMCISGKDPTLTKGEELKRNWLLLLTALLGGAMLPIPIYSVSLFMESWGREFGWSRPEMGLANSSFTIAMVVAAPITGRLIDRFGSRAPAMISLLLLAGMFAATSLVNEQIWTLYAAYALLAFAGSGTSPIAFTKTVCAYFERACDRGKNCVGPDTCGDHPRSRPPASHLFRHCRARPFRALAFTGAPSLGAPR